jgi:hypothetical protein
MPPECSAFLSGDVARELVGRIEGCPDDQHLLGRRSAFQPGSRATDSAMIHGRDDGIRAHLENVSVLGPDGDIKHALSFAGCESRSGFEAFPAASRQIARANQRANRRFSTATQGGTMKTAMKKPNARLEVSLGNRLTPAEKAAIEIWAKREERSPSVVERRRRSCDCLTYGPGHYETWAHWRSVRPVDPVLCAIAWFRRQRRPCTWWG